MDGVGRNSNRLPHDSGGIIFNGGNESRRKLPVNNDNSGTQNRQGTPALPNVSHFQVAEFHSNPATFPDNTGEIKLEAA